MAEAQQTPGYHLRDISRGQYGEASKIIEEAEEFADAIAQNATIMALIELADMIGAIEAYLAKFNLTLDDVRTMARINGRAFANGHRTPR
jgi:phosphoribosyl-ATP pyrophosphohydrolase